MAINNEKNIYYKTRNDKGLKRKEVINMLEEADNYSISEDRLERIENSRTTILPNEVLALAEIYKEPVLCNHFCAYECAIGSKMNLALDIPELPNIVLETVASLNEIEPLTKELIAISRDGQISDDEIPALAKIKVALDHAYIAINALDKWVEKEASNSKLNSEMLKQEMEKLCVEKII